MIEELRNDELTTAGLAVATEPTALNNDPNLIARKTELKLADIPAGDALTRAGKRDAGSAEAAATAAGEQSLPLFSTDEATELRVRWDSIQGGFVDEPRQAVAHADSLVAGTMKRLAEMFAEERAKLDGKWDRGADVSTEDLRLALRCYRSFFGRLLSV